MAGGSFLSIEEVNATLENGLEKIFQQDRFQDYLKLMTQFPSYSLNNTLLIMTQKPHATMVQGYKAWQQMGRNVNKGESSIRILAPSIKKMEVEKINPETKKPEIDASGNKVTEKKNMINGFRLVSVFDVSQTEGKEIPSVRDFINRELSSDESMSKLYGSFFNHIKENYDYDIREDKTDSGVGGYYNRKTNEIVISSNNNSNDTEKFRVLVHEFAHANLHHMESEMKDYARGHKEAQAESTAYIVSNYYGLETDDISLGYIATWAKDLPLAKQAIGEIQKVASQMIKTLDELQSDKVLEFYGENNKEYDKAITYLSSKFELSEDSLSIKNENNPQFELLKKDMGMVISGKMEFSEKTEKYHFRTSKNMIIPLTEITKSGDYIALNKELEKGQLEEITKYKRVPDLFEVSELPNGKYAVVSIGGTDLVSKEYTDKGAANKELLRTNLSQSLHEQSFLKTHLQINVADEVLNERVQANNIQINFDVSNYLTANTQQIFIPGKDDGAKIGWTLMKNRNIETISDLKEFADKTKHMPSHKPFREALENTNQGEKRNESKNTLELER